MFQFMSFIDDTQLSMVYGLLRILIKTRSGQCFQEKVNSMDCLAYIQRETSIGYPDEQWDNEDVSPCTECDYAEFCTESMRRNCELAEIGYF